MSCTLSPSAAAFSTMVSAFVGSVVNGLCSGMLIAFITGWISWLAVLRILAAGVYELYLAFKAGRDFDAVTTARYESIVLDRMDRMERQMQRAAVGGQFMGGQDVRDAGPATDPLSTTTASDAHKQPPSKRSWRAMLTPSQKTVTPFGWLGWIWSAIYTPLSQTIWVGVHVRSSAGIVQFVRALAIGVSALSLTFDTKQRYGAALGRRWGAWAFMAFNVWNASACVLLGVEALALLVHAAVTTERVPIALLVVYPFLAVVWALASWHLVPPVDGARPGFHVVVDVLVGAFAGLFVAAPAFALWRNNKFKEDSGWGGDEVSGMDLGEFLACHGTSFWEKFAAVMP